MKKLLAVLALLSLVAVAHASNVWNIKWYITGAYSPDDPSKGVLEDYSVTWQLINATDGDSVIDSMYAVKGSQEIYVTDPYNDEVLYYDSRLKPDDSTTYYGVTDLTGVKSVYQYIFLDNGVDQYEWKSSAVDIELSASTMKPAEAIDKDAVLGKTTAWTKVSAVPEPATMSLLGLGALAMVIRRRIRR